MPAPQGVARFPGVSQIIDCNFTLSHGVTPSRALMRIVPQAGLIAQVGELSFRYGQTVIRFPGCRVRRASIQRDSGGRIVSLEIEDRRWKWQYGEISGLYNMRGADNKLDKINSTEKSPQELAKLLLQAMGEQRYDLSQLSNSTRPEVNWVADNPAAQLLALCDSLGCRVVLTTTDTVRLCRVGVGNALPNIGAQSAEGFGLETEARPNKIRFICGPSVWQSKLKLEPVGLDLDGRIKPIDQLSYYPDNGKGSGFRWDNWPGDRLNINAGRNKSPARALAEATVYKWYRVAEQADRPKLRPYYCPIEEVDLLRQFIFRSTLARKKFEPDERNTADQEVFSDAEIYVEGVYYGGSLRFSNTEENGFDTSGFIATKGRMYVDGFSFDQERGIVKFNDFVYKLSTSGGNQIHRPADLWLTCSYTLKDKTTNSEYRHTIDRSVTGGTPGTKPLIIRDDSVFRVTIAHYQENSPLVIQTISFNEDEVDAAANYAIDAKLAEIQSPRTNDIEYAGLVNISPDGAIQQVNWRVSTRGAATRASRNSEFNPAIPSYQERLRQTLVAAALQRNGTDPDNRALTKRRRRA